MITEMVRLSYKRINSEELSKAMTTDDKFANIWRADELWEKTSEKWYKRIQVGVAVWKKRDLG